jgi:glutathione S-transferase
MIDLYQPSPYFNLPNLSPFCMKLEAFLRIAEIPYQVIIEDNYANAPKAKLPYIRDNGITVSDSELIIDYLESKLGFEVDGHLSSQQKVTHHACIRMLDEHLYWVLQYSRWLDEDNFKQLKTKLFHDTPPPLNSFKAQAIRKRLKLQLESQGLGRHGSDEIYQKAEKDIRHLAMLLGEKNWFGGDYIAKLDLAASAYLCQILISELPSPLSRMVQQEDNLMAYATRSRRILFPENFKKTTAIPGARIKLEP